MKPNQKQNYVPTDKLARAKYDIAESLTTICDLQNSTKLKNVSEKERYNLFNSSMIKICKILDIDLDMHELLKSGSQGFNYSEQEENTKSLQEILSLDSNSEEPQANVKSIIELLKNDLGKSDSDLVSLSTLINCEIDLLSETLGMPELSTSPRLIESQNTIKAQLQDLHSLNRSMFKDDIHAVPRFTDGTEITAKDLADMNINTLDNIAELLGFELDE